MDMRRTEPILGEWFSIRIWEPSDKHEDKVELFIKCKKKNNRFSILRQSSKIRVEMLPVINIKSLSLFNLRPYMDSLKKHFLPIWKMVMIGKNQAGCTLPTHLPNEVMVHIFKDIFNQGFTHEVNKKNIKGQLPSKKLSVEQTIDFFSDKKIFIDNFTPHTRNKITLFFCNHMPIYVVSSEGLCFHMEVDPSDSIDAVRRKIMKYIPSLTLGHDPMPKLIHERSLLTHGKLSDYNISPFSTIYLKNN